MAPYGDRVILDGKQGFLLASTLLFVAVILLAGETKLAIGIFVGLVASVGFLYGIKWFRYGQFWTVWLGKRARRKQRKIDRSVARKG